MLIKNINKGVESVLMNCDSPQLSKNERRNLAQKSKGKASKNEREIVKIKERGEKREKGIGRGRKRMG